MCHSQIYTKDCKTPESYILYNLNLISSLPKSLARFSDFCSLLQWSLCWASGQCHGDGLLALGYLWLPFLGSSALLLRPSEASDIVRLLLSQATLVNTRSLNKWLVPIKYFPDLISLPYFGVLVVTTYEMIALVIATNLVLWIVAIDWIVHKYPLPVFMLHIFSVFS